MSNRQGGENFFGRPFDSIPRSKPNAGASQNPSGAVGCAAIITLAGALIGGRALFTAKQGTNRTAQGKAVVAQQTSETPEDIELTEEVIERRILEE